MFDNFPPLPVVCDELWTAESKVRWDACDDFEKQHKSQVHRVFLHKQRSLATEWIDLPFLRTLKPEKMNLTKLANLLGVNRGNVSRYFDDEQVPSDEVVYQWLLVFGKTRHDLPTERVRLPLAVAASMEAANYVVDARRRERHQKPDELASLPRQRMEFLHSILLYPLVNPSRMQESWVDIVRVYEDNLLAAAKSPLFFPLLNDLIDEAVNVLMNDPVLFVEEIAKLNAVDLDSPESVVSFLEPVVFHWNRLGVTASLTLECTKPLFFHEAL